MSRKGEKAFDGCRVKSWNFTDFVFVKDPGRIKSTSSVVEPQYGYPVARVPAESKEGGVYAGSSATLQCPRVQDTGMRIRSSLENHNGHSNAYDSLRQNAGKMACAVCPFSSMDQIEVAQYRARWATAQAEQIRAFSALEQARREIDRIADVNTDRPPLPE